MRLNLWIELTMKTIQNLITNSQVRNQIICFLIEKLKILFLVWTNRVEMLTIWMLTMWRTHMTLFLMAREVYIR